MIAVLVGRLGITDERLGIIHAIDTYTEFHQGPRNRLYLDCRRLLGHIPPFVQIEPVFINRTCAGIRTWVLKAQYCHTGFGVHLALDVWIGVEDEGSRTHFFTVYGALAFEDVPELSEIVRVVGESATGFEPGDTGQWLGGILLAGMKGNLAPLTRPTDLFPLQIIDMHSLVGSPFCSKLRSGLWLGAGPERAPKRCERTSGCSQNSLGNAIFVAGPRNSLPR